MKSLDKIVRGIGKTAVLASALTFGGCYGGGASNYEPVPPRTETRQDYKQNGVETDSSKENDYQKQDSLPRVEMIPDIEEDSDSETFVIDSTGPRMKSGLESDYKDESDKQYFNEKDGDKSRKPQKRDEKDYEPTARPILEQLDERYGDSTREFIRYGVNLIKELDEAVKDENNDYDEDSALRKLDEKTGFREIIRHSAELIRDIEEILNEED